MYELTDIERDRYNKCILFRQTCDLGCKGGFSKEQMLSKLLMYMLEEKDAEDKRKLDELMSSCKPSIFSWD